MIVPEVLPSHRARATRRTPRRAGRGLSLSDGGAAITKRVCAQHGCPVLVDPGPHCDEHTRARDKARGTRAERGYDHKHKARSKQERANAIGTTCHLCGEPILEGQRLALDHTVDRTGYRGVAHLSCNSRDGALRRPR